MEDAVRNSGPVITPGNLSSTIGFLKEMGRGAEIPKLLQAYVAGRKGEGRKFWDLTEHTFEEVKDADVMETFKRQLDSYEEKRDPGDVLARIGEQKGWNPEDVSFLAGLNIDDFYKVFKTRKGRDLRLTIYGGLMFRSIANADEEMKRVTEKAEAALRKIGCESPINARRIRKYGIEIESPGGIPTTKT